VAIIIQQDATICSLFISVNRSTCFGWYLDASSGAHVTVSTVSGIIETVTANCRERDLTETAVTVKSRSRQVAVRVLPMPDAVDTVTCALDDGSRYHPKHVERFTDINKLYIVASCWIGIATCYTMHGSLTHKKKNYITASYRMRYRWT